MKRVSYTTNLNARAQALSFSFATNSADHIYDYLNAYNAPNWVAIFGGGSNAAADVPMVSNEMPGWYNNQRSQNGDSGKVERWGTSWLRDLMVAKSYAPEALQPVRTYAYPEQTQVIGATGTRSRFNGITDANHGYTPVGHASRDLGMAMDLGIHDFVSLTNQSRQGEAVPSVTIPAGTPTWSEQRAIQLSGLLNVAPTAPNSSNPTANNQRDMTRDFLSLYRATKSDLKVRDELGNQTGVWVIVNGASDTEKQEIQNLLFRGGNVAGQPDANVSLITRVHIGAESKNNGNVLTNRYPDVNNVLGALGINSNFAAPHEHHFHIYIRPPVAEVLKSQNLRVDEPENSSKYTDNNFLNEDELIAANFPKTDRKILYCQNWGGVAPTFFRVRWPRLFM